MDTHLGAMIVQFLKSGKPEDEKRIKAVMKDEISAACQNKRNFKYTNQTFYCKDTFDETVTGQEEDRIKTIQFHPAYNLPFYIEFFGEKEYFSTVAYMLIDDIINIIRSITLSCNTLSDFDLNLSHDSDNLDNYLSLMTFIKAPDRAFIRQLAGDKKSRNKALRKRLGMLLNNKIFAPQIRAYQKKKYRVGAALENEIKGSKFANMQEIIDFIAQLPTPEVRQRLLRKVDKTPSNKEPGKKFNQKQYDDYEIAGWLLYYSLGGKYRNRALTWLDRNQAACDKLLYWLKEKLNVTTDINHISKSIDKIKKDLNSYLVKITPDMSLDHSGDEDSQEDNYEVHAELKEPFNCFHSYARVERINLQEKAFFWTPLQSHFWEDTIPEELPNPERPIFIVYFIKWLREHSGATDQDISLEIGVHHTEVSRWEAIDKIHFPFWSEKMKSKKVTRWRNKNKIWFDLPDWEDAFFCPVFFSPKALASGGTDASNIRKYQKKDYTGEKFKEVTKYKTELWSIYALLRDLDFIGDMETGATQSPYARNNDGRYPFEYEIKDRRQIEEMQAVKNYRKTQPFVYIRRIGR